ncbi:MAG: hypothetical protein IJK23_12740 [Clostridia bacterium]|nr:hypothetical protein [Clostridia bacterium]
MLKRILCVAAILAVCVATAISLGGCGRDLGDLTEPAVTEPAAAPTQAGAKETIVITIDANEFSALLSQIGGQIPVQTAPAAQPTEPVPATVAP